MKGLMWKLLRKHVSAVQLVGFALANLVGLTIVILAIQFYQDVRPLFADEESFVKRDYLVVSRKVTGAGALFGGKSDFSAEAIADLEGQPWVRKVGKFVTSDYSVRASVSLGLSGAAMTTQLFFESIPTEFIDVNSSDWRFDPQNPEVPVIVSKDYLALYNFGFAAAQGMPQISEGMIEMIPLQFTLRGNGKVDTIEGKIVGFSNRLNTILVPYEFMEWSNSRYGSGKAEDPSRLIVEVNSPGDLKIGQYMDEHRYEIAGDKANSGKANYFLTIVVGIVAMVGVLISLLSFFVLMLSIYLLLQKNNKKLQDLLMLGYLPQQVSAPYIRMVMIINDSVLMLSIVLMLLGRAVYLPMLEGFGIEGASVLPSVIVAIVIMGLITVGNVMAIRNKVDNLWRQEKTA